MAGTPPKGIHWNNTQLSPDSPSASTESYISTSSLDYVNAQLVAHGYVPSPGLSLDGLSGTDSDRVVKCLLGMLGQRVVSSLALLVNDNLTFLQEDMSRTEQISTKLRTLTYDHERLLTMERTSKEKAANAEKEVHLYKTKLTYALSLPCIISTHSYDQVRPNELCNLLKPLTNKPQPNFNAREPPFKVSAPPIRLNSGRKKRNSDE